MKVIVVGGRGGMSRVLLAKLVVAGVQLMPHGDVRVIRARPEPPPLVGWKLPQLHGRPPYGPPPKRRKGKVVKW